MPLILPQRRTLAYPAGVAPGVDFSHPAAQGLQFSAVATAGKNMISLTQGIIGAIIGAPSYALDGSIGPAFVTSGVAVNCSARFAGHPATVDSVATIAGIVKVSTGAGQGAMFMSSGVIAGYVLYYTATDLELAYVGAGGSASSLPLVVDVPYFYIASAISGTTNFLTKRLDTGQISTSVAGAPVGAPNAGDGTYTVGDDNSNGVFVGKTSTVMFAKNYMTMPEMLAWAQDPWAFWYPRLVPASSHIVTATQYAAFCTPQRDGAVYTQMTGY